jgi:hypothetical protein
MFERVGPAVLLVLLSLLMSCQASEPGQAKPREQVAAPAQPVATPTSLPESDDEAIPITLPSTQPRKPGVGPGFEGVGPSESFGPGSSLPDCLSSCGARELSDDNRATCRLLCESHYSRGGTAEADHGALVDAYVGCFDQCDGESSCRKRCADDVGRDNACKRVCLDNFGRCLAPCEGAAEEGHCAERCETSARACVQKC